MHNEKRSAVKHRDVIIMFYDAQVVRIKISAKSLTTARGGVKLNESVDGDGPYAVFSESVCMVKGRKTDGQAHHP